MPDGRNADAASRWMAAMRRGEHEAAWTVSDAVLAARDEASSDDAGLPYHRRWLWDGSSLAGCEVLVRCYHGLGDTLQFARFLPALARMAAVIVEAQPCLLPLLETSSLATRFVPFAPERPHPPLARCVEIMELSHALRLSPRAVAPPYLRVPQAEIAEQRQRFAGTRPIAALCWRPGKWDRERSPPLDALLRCFPPTWRLVQLQPDASAAERRAARFLNAEDRLARILDTAALISCADLVVTADTMVAHLAGALGRPGAVLLKCEADWRWESGKRSSWYPTLQLFRQARPGDWVSALRALTTALACSPAD
jgi:Glycosyltransferase family 9 (heptosyltransferase)